MDTNEAGIYAMVTPRNVLITVAGILALCSLMKGVVPAPYQMIKQVDTAILSVLESVNSRPQSCITSTISSDCE